MSTVTRKKQIKQQSSTEMIEQLLTNLKSTNIEEREESCRTFTMILLEEPMTSSIPGIDRQPQQQISADELIEKFGERIIPLLLENFTTVSSALSTIGIDTRAKREDLKLALSLLTSASEALKNLCSKGGVLVCQRLTNNHNGVKIIFDLVNALASFNMTPPPPPPQPDGTTTTADDDAADEIVEDVVGILIQLILVLTELAENCEKSLELITKSGVAFKFLDLIFSAAEEASTQNATQNTDPWKKLVNGSKDIKVVICKFLGTITDNNPVLAKLIIEHFPAGVFKSTVLGKLNTLFGRLGCDTAAIVTALFSTDDSGSNGGDDLEVLALMASFTYNILRNYYVPDEDPMTSYSSPEAVELVEAFVPLFAKILSLSPATLLRTVVEPGMMALDNMHSSSSTNAAGAGTSEDKDIGTASAMMQDDDNDDDAANADVEVETDEHFAEKLEILQKWKQIGAAQQVLLETLTNICFCEGEAEDDIDMNDDDMDDADIAVTQESASSSTTTTEAAPTILAIEKSGILDVVTQRASDVTDFAMEFIGRHAWSEGHVTILFTVQSRALACLNNVIISNGTIANTQALWQFAEAITLSALRSCESARASASMGGSNSSINSSDDDGDLFKIEIELLEEATSILDSVARRFFGPEDLPRLTWRPALDTLLRVAQAGLSDSAALHVVGAIGSVGALYTGSVLETETIINALLVIIMDEASNIELVCAAANAVIDLFAEKPANPAMYVSHAKIVTAFTQILPSFKRRTALEKKKGDKSLFLRLDETRINMARLIKYKAAQNLTTF